MSRRGTPGRTESSRNIFAEPTPIPRGNTRKQHQRFLDSGAQFKMTSQQFQQAERGKEERFTAPPHIRKQPISDRKTAEIQQHTAVNKDKTLTKKLRRLRHEAIKKLAADERRKFRQRDEQKKEKQKRHEEFALLNTEIRQRRAREWFNGQSGEIADLKLKRLRKDSPARSRAKLKQVAKKEPSPIAQLAKKRQSRFIDDGTF